ncbi:MAG: flippase [bacterium]|nr:flippase [bacterium]
MNQRQNTIKIHRTSRLSGALLLSSAQAVLLGLGYITHILVGKLGGPSLYGVYGIVLSFMTILNMLITLGIPIAVSKEVAQDEANSGAILKSALIGQLCLAIILSLGTIIFSKPIASILGDASLAPIIAFTAIVYPLTAIYSVITNYFNGLHAFALQASIVLLYSFAKLAGSVGLLVPFRVYGALSGFAVGGAIASLIGAPFVYRATRKHFQKPFPLNKLLTFAGAVVGTAIALQILMSTDLFLVKKFLHDDTLAGYYNAASTLSRIPYFILQALGFIFLPSIARLMKENEDLARDFIRVIFRYLYLLLLPVTVLAAATSKSLVHLFYSKVYEPAAQPLTLLMVALGLLSAFYLLSTIAAGANKARVPLIIAWSMLPFDIVLGSFLIPRFGLEGAALSTIITAVIGTTIMAGYMIKRFRLSFPLNTLFKGLTATIIMVLPTYFINVRPLFMPLIYVALVILYILVLVALGELSKDDLKHVKTLIPKNKTANSENEGTIISP